MDLKWIRIITRNYKKNVKNISEKYNIPDGRFDLYNAGVWDNNEKLPYGKEAFGSKESFSLLKNETVDYAQLVKIDELLDSQKVSMIKMDIEGAESKALEGAKNVILQNKPKMAICLYHRLQDFWEVPTFIKSLVPEYKIYVRHHQNGTMGGTVMYALCDK